MQRHMSTEDASAVAHNAEAATRCPECRKAFRVTADQLAQAEGLVRCGHCQHLFQARQHLLALASAAPSRPRPDRKKQVAGAELEAVVPSPRTPAVPASRPEPGSPKSLEGLSQPVDVHYRRKPWVRRLALSVACLLGLCGLAVQYLGYNAPEIARKGGWLRHPLALVCSWGACPSFDALSWIRLQEVVVRPGSGGDMFRIDALLINTAITEQPYPDLQLEISDEQHARLALRVLRPEDYLSGAAAGGVLMPVEQPVRIVLQVDSPGPEAHYVALDLASPEVSSP